MGFFKMSGSDENQEFSRQSSFRRSKKKNKVKKEGEMAEVKDAGRSNSVNKTLPRNMGSKVHANFTSREETEPEEDLEFGIYSTIPDATPKGSAASTPSGDRKVSR